MTHDELLDAIDRQIITAPPFALGGYTRFLQALRAVVELHEPAIVIYPKEMQILMCMECGDEEGLRYPCPTIQAIQSALE